VIDAEHWLWRLDATAWAAAAEVEWQSAKDNVAKRRTAIAHCRRAGGMALNAVLVASRSDERDVEHMWGRSYVEHLQRVAAGDTGPLGPDAAAAAAAILATPMTAPALVGLGARAHADVTRLVEHTRTLLDLCAAACGGAGL
jgi:hypothetical protein